MDKTTGVSDRNCVHTVKSNALHISYTEFTRSKIKSFMDSLHDCVERTHNSEVSGRAQTLGFPRDTGFYLLMAVTGTVCKSYNILSKTYSY